MNQLVSEKRVLSIKAAMFVEASYLCPICKKPFESREELSRHFESVETRDSVEYLAKNKGKFT
jgi:hypothetical protein